MLLARQTGRPTVEINPGESRVSHVVDVRVPLGAAAALDAIWQRFLERSEERTTTEDTEEHGG